jgi:Trk K+ transport system NAD-binding subunit
VAHRELDALGDGSGRADVLLFGLGRFGAAVAANLRERGRNLLAVDFDPEAVRHHAREGFATRYGDAEDPEFLATLPLMQVKWVVSTMRDPALNRALLQGLRHQDYRGKVALTVASRRDAEHFAGEGVDLVLIPYADAAREAADRLDALDE